MFGYAYPRRGSAALLLCAGLLTAGTALSAAGAETRSAPLQAQGGTNADEARICKRVVPTGSRIARRYCLTKSQWDSMREEGQRAARDAFAMESQFGYEAPGGT